MSDASDDDVESAAKIACAHDFITLNGVPDFKTPANGNGALSIASLR